MVDGQWSMVHGRVLPKACQASWEGIGCSRKLAKHLGRESDVRERLPSILGGSRVFPKGCQASWEGIGCSRRVAKHLGRKPGVPERLSVGRRTNRVFPKAHPQRYAIARSPVADPRPTASNYLAQSATEPRARHYQLSIINYQLFTIHYSLLNNRHHHPKTATKLGIVGLRTVGAAYKSIKKKGFLAALAFKVLGKII